MHSAEAGNLREIRDEARRAMEICNACRYCEGFCAVFPTMERRRTFLDADLDYLANLCHGCRGCYYACQYAPPHEFGINLPRTFAELRGETYAEYAWPAPLGRVFRRNGTVVALTLAFGLALVLLLSFALVSPDALYGAHTGPGAFYAVIPWWTMTLVAGVTFIFALVALGMGGVRFWRATGGGDASDPRTLEQAVRDVLTLRNLGGGGHGCNDRDESFSMTRRWLHHALFYGFLLCFAATVVATIYHHLLDSPAPYDVLSLPVMLGTVGGVLMLVGAGGLTWIKVSGDPAPTAPTTMGAEYALLLLLALTAFTGLLLLAFRATPAMGMLLAIHLGVVLSLFLLLPYSRFVHGVYRSLALLRHAMERGR